MLLPSSATIFTTVASSQLSSVHPKTNFVGHKLYIQSFIKVICGVDQPLPSDVKTRSEPKVRLRQLQASYVFKAVPQCSCTEYMSNINLNYISGAEVVWKVGASRSEIGLFCDALVGLTSACHNTKFGIHVAMMIY